MVDAGLEEGAGGGDAGGSDAGNVGSSNGEGVNNDSNSGGGSDDAGNTDSATNTDSTPVDFFSTAPEDWRDQMLKKAGYQEGDDFDKAKKQLDRVSDFGVLTKNYLSAQDKIRSGEISNGLPENPSDEQMAAYREAHGIPETPDGYELKLDEGLVLGEADERIMKSVFDIAHTANVPSEAINAMTNAMLLGRQAESEAMVSQDGLDRQAADRMLKESWGGDYQTNVNMVKGLVDQLPETVRKAFESARLADGKALFNSPEMVVAMAEWSRKINPSATVVPNSGNPMQTMNDEISTLEGRMGEPGWHKDTEAQTRYQALITARDAMAAQ